MKGKKGKKATRRSFLISLIIHGIAFVVLALYIFNIPEKVEEALDFDFFKPVRKPNPRVRRAYTPKVLPKPVLTTEELEYATEVDKSKPPAMRGVLSAGSQRSSVKPATVTEFTSQRIMQGASNPSLEAAAKVTSQVTTDAKIDQITDVSLGEPSSIPGESAAGSGLLADQTAVGGSGGLGSGLSRGEFGEGGQGGSGGMGRGAPIGIESLTLMTGSNDMASALKDVAVDVSLGQLPVVPLARGEPGGKVVGRGRDITGVLRFTRLKHRLADWWADPTSVIGLVNWINAKTKIRADINVEGGSLELTNPNLMRCPLVIMTGHDPELVCRYKSYFDNCMFTPSDMRLTPQERAALRKYLVEKGGLLFYDDCGLDSVNWPLMLKLISELRSVMPEYPAMFIPNDHELYSCFYELGGPPWGVAGIWRHGPKGPIPKRLKGVFIGDDLAVILSHRDYLCGAQTVNVHAGKVHKASGAYRFMTNVAVYSLTHGGISDYKDYVPDDSSKDDELPQRAPMTPRATPNVEE